MGDFLFRFTDSEWDKISAELGQTGCLKFDGDRQILETTCGIFVYSRRRVGRGTPTPARARKAWREVASAAHKLALAIAGLRAAGAADFGIPDDHQGEAKSWAAQLPSIINSAKSAAEYEMAGTRTVSNRADPLRDRFVEQLTMFWKSYGGRISHGDGPLVRFLSAVTSSALTRAGEKPMRADAIKGAVRRIKEAMRAETNSNPRHTRMASSTQE